MLEIEPFTPGQHLVVNLVHPTEDSIVQTWMRSSPWPKDLWIRN